MPIYSLEGTPGSGKTLYCVQKIIPDFLKIRDSRGELVPRHIYTNIEGLRPEIICALAGIPYESIADYFHMLGQAVDEKGRTYEDKDLVRYWFYEPESIEWVQETNSARQVERHPDWEKAKPIPLGSLVIIDEVQNYYSNRDFATIYSKRCIDYITKNRHYGWTMWWMSQSVESVDVTFRRNTQYVYFLERKEIYGSANSSSVKMYEGWLSGDKVNTPPFAKQTFRFDSRYYAAYQSYVQGVSQKEKRYKVNVFLQHKGFMAVVIIIALCVVALLFSHPLDTLSGKGGKVAQRAKAVSAQATATAPTLQSSSGVVGAGAKELSTLKRDSLCVQSWYTQRGQTYVVRLSGKVEKLQPGVQYEDCR